MAALTEDVTGEFFQARHPRTESCESVSRDDEQPVPGNNYCWKRGAVAARSRRGVSNGPDERKSFPRWLKREDTVQKELQKEKSENDEQRPDAEEDTIAVISCRKILVDGLSIVAPAIC